MPEICGTRGDLGKIRCNSKVSADLLFQIGNFALDFLFQKDGDLSKQDTVVFLLQDMLEVVTRDMMLNEVRLANIFSVI